MSVEKLLAALEKEARMREEAMMKKAEAQAEAILAEAEKKAEQMDHIISGLKKEHALRLEKSRGAEEKIRARAAALGRGWRIAGLAFSLAEERFARFMQSPRYPRFIIGKLKEAVDELGDVGRVAADPVTAAALRGNGFSIVEDAGVEKGFAAHSLEGGKQARFLFSEALVGLWRKQAHLSHDDLFPETPDAG